MTEKAEHLHFIGIGGIGVSGVARIAMARGHRVSGSDVRESQITRAIAEEGAKVTIGHRPENLAGCERVVVSTAIPSDNVELQAARKAGIPVIHRSQMLAQLAVGKHTIGVTGTHGKGTISAMITRILEQAGWKPGFVIGGLVHDYGTNARWGEGDWMVLEVDESDGSHHRIAPEYLVCNYLEPDHLNYYKDLDHIIRSMAECLQHNPRLVKAFVNGDCQGNRRLLQTVSRPVVTYGVETEADYRGQLLDRGQFPIRFRATGHGVPLGEGALAIPGHYNLVNAMGALALTAELGIPFPVARSALAEFRGLENRFSILDAGGLTIVKDYISHPTGMKRVLESAAQLTQGRIFSVWKPYRYTLLSYLQEEYATAFAGSHEVLLTTMYGAEEDPIEGVDTEFIARKIRQSGMNVTVVPKDEDLIGALEQRVRIGDEVIFFGGDDFFQMADRWALRLRARPLG
ncbi:MAG: UDP-N-acetylmuramate--L-alanine ligase [Bradymonadales bacterium]|nr:UDP-N-acetylmuramate--L-alanine ligase [Bradymonadales bacterium]